MKKACGDNNASAAKNALIAWGKLEYKATSLGVIASCCNARLRDEILELNRVLYSKEAGQWQGKKLFQAFSEHKARRQLSPSEDRSLEPLYRL
ncbi:MAG: BatD family protein [Methylosarcina sp.]